MRAQLPCQLAYLLRVPLIGLKIFDNPETDKLSYFSLKH